VLLIALPAAAASVRRDARQLTEVIVTLKAPPLADAPTRALQGQFGRTLSVTSASSRAYIQRLGRAQDGAVARIMRAIPGASIRWRYHTVLDGMAVVLPREQVGKLARVPGIARVWPNGVYHAQLDRTPQLIGAPQVWGPGLATGGQGMKIAIIDEGIDQTHPFFNSAGFVYPPGFPKGNAAFTTPKVIVARVFAPPGANDPLETLPFAGADGQDDHGTIVAGVAGGDANTLAKGFRISGIAPRAYLGNYKALAAPTPGVGLDGNAPELAAAVEAAVNDGMNVINMSLGEAEVDPRRDPVVQALNAAADAGVVPVVAAGNDFQDFGNGSVESPANAPKAIAVAASTGGHSSPKPDRIAPWSSGGPTPYSFQLKPDVTAPGVGILTSEPPATWVTIDGTSLAAPHVAGAAAVLKQRHPDWTVAQIKSALVSTGAPVHYANGHEVAATREGGGRIDLPRADNPQIFVSPTSLSFGLRRPGTRTARTVAVINANVGGNLPLGRWTVKVALQGSSRGVIFSVPSRLSVPGRFRVAVRAAPSVHERDVTGFIVLSNTGTRLRIPFWLRIERPRLALDPQHVLPGAGVYRGTTVGAASQVTTYRYPDLVPNSFALPVRLGGPEVVYRFRLRRPVANFGVAILSPARGVTVQPRVVRDDDENRVTGYTGVPVDLNPYRSSVGTERPVAGVVLPKPDTYDIVFDSPARSARGPFTFRFWINDTTPPSVHVLSASHGVIRLAVRDNGAGVDPRSLHATIDEHPQRVSFANGVARISGVARGSHTLIFRTSDYQETKNMEDVGPILPNTRTLMTTVLVR
jgi:subtilisin family serine protease